MSVAQLQRPRFTRVQQMSALSEPIPLSDHPLSHVKWCIPTRVVDGDTFDARVAVSMSRHYLVRIRVRGVDCPERGKPGYGKCGQRTVDWLSKAVREDGGVRLRVVTNRDECVIGGPGHNSMDVFGRLLADVSTDDEKLSVVLNALIKEGFEDPEPE